MSCSRAPRQLQMRSMGTSLTSSSRYLSSLKTKLGLQHLCVLECRADLLSSNHYALQTYHYMDLQQMVQRLLAIQIPCAIGVNA